MGLSYGNQVGTLYPNIVDQLAAQNITQSRAFSLDLGSIDTPEGRHAAFFFYQDVGKGSRCSKWGSL